MYYDRKKPDVMNWRLLEGSILVGKYDFPKLLPVHNAHPVNLVPFNQIGTAKDKQNSWFHFYVDDYRLERLWRMPEHYLPVLLEYAGGFGPDFSMLMDQPRGQMIYNAWRNYVLTYWLQRIAAETEKQILPNACFGDTDSFDWVFEPLPEKSAISITTQGCIRNHICTQVLLNGLHELIRQKHPTQLFVYGLFPDAWRDKFPVEIIVLDTFSKERWVG